MPQKKNRKTGINYSPNYHIWVSYYRHMNKKKIVTQIENEMGNDGIFTQRLGPHPRPLTPFQLLVA